MTYSSDPNLSRPMYRTNLQKTLRTSYYEHTRCCWNTASKLHPVGRSSAFASRIKITSTNQTTNIVIHFELLMDQHSLLVALCTHRTAMETRDISFVIDLQWWHTFWSHTKNQQQVWFEKPRVCTGKPAVTDYNRSRPFICKYENHSVLQAVISCV